MFAYSSFLIPLLRREALKGQNTSAKPFVLLGLQTILVAKAIPHKNLKNIQAHN